MIGIDVNKAIGKRLRFLRKTMLGMSAISFADKIGISAYKLMSYEKGNCPVPADVIVTIADMYFISADWLLCINAAEG